jgi:hypothetical protein
MRWASYVRLFADEKGESHFADVEVELGPIDFAPPAPRSSRRRSAVSCVPRRTGAARSRTRRRGAS